MPEGDRQYCSSNRPGDFKYRACGTFCKAERVSQHCGFCKCMTCTFCEKAAGAATSVETGAVLLSKGTNGSKSPSTSIDGGATSSAASITSQPITDGKHASLSIDVPSLQVALRAADARARSAEARLAAMEKQLSMCRRASQQLRSAATSRHHSDSGGGGGEGAAAAAATAASPAVAPFRSNATSSRQACEEAIDHALAQLVRFGYRLDARGGTSELFPGLNASSPRDVVRLWLHQHQKSDSRCADPRLAASSAAAEQDARMEAIASGLLLLGVMFCALLNAWSLGYLQPNRHVRGALACLGCEPAPLVR